MKHLIALLLLVPQLALAASAYYKHHERSTLAALETDLVTREIGLDKANKRAVAKFNDGTFAHLVSKEQPAVALDGTLDVTGTSYFRGRVGLGYGPSTNRGLLMGGTSLALSGTQQVGLDVDPYFTSSATSSGIAALIEWNTTGSFSMAKGHGLYIIEPYYGSATVDSMIGLQIDNIGTEAKRVAIKTGTGKVIFGDTVRMSSTLIVADVITGSDNVSAGNGVGSRSLIVNGAVGATKSLRFQTAGVNHWTLQENSAGTALSLVAQDASGVTIDSPIAITGAAGGTMAISRPTTIATTLAIGGNEAFTYDEGSFLGTLTGVTTTVTGTIYFTRIGKAVTLHIPTLSGTSNTTACTITGAPASIFPARNQHVAAPEIQNNGTFASGSFRVGTDGIITLYHGAAGLTPGFTAANAKGTATATTITYTML